MNDQKSSDGSVLNKAVGGNLEIRQYTLIEIIEKFLVVERKQSEDVWFSDFC